MTLERDIEDEVCLGVEAEGGLPLRLAPEGVRGFPDRTIILPEGKICFIEFKRPGGVTSPHQIEWIHKLINLGHDVDVCDTVKHANYFIDTVRGNK